MVRSSRVSGTDTERLAQNANGEPSVYSVVPNNAPYIIGEDNNSGSTMTAITDSQLTCPFDDPSAGACTDGQCPAGEHTLSARDPLTDAMSRLRLQH